MSDRTLKARDLRGLSRVVAIGLYVSVAASVVDIASSLQQMADPSLLSVDEPLTEGGVFALADGLIQLVTTAGVAFVVLKWMYRVRANACVLKPGLRPGPGWMVGYFFVPLANLWLPWRLFRDAWRVSVQPAAPSSVETPAILRAWWALWLAASFAGNIAVRLDLYSETARDDQAASIAGIVYSMLVIALDLVFLIIVRRMCAIQTQALSESVFD